MDEVTAELSARPFPKFDLPTNIFRVCVRGRDAFSSVKDVISDLLPDIDWDIAQQGKLIYAKSDNVSINIERHTEFTSVTLISASAEELSLASFLPDGWSDKILGDIVVAVDCQCRARSGPPPTEFPCAYALVYKRQDESIGIVQKVCSTCCGGEEKTRCDDSSIIAIARGSDQ